MVEYLSQHANDNVEKRVQQDFKYNLLEALQDSRKTWSIPNEILGRRAKTLKSCLMVMEINSDQDSTNNFNSFFTSIEKENQL